MMKKYYLLILIGLLILLIASAVQAVKPTVTKVEFSGTVGYQIESPLPTYIRQNQDHKLNFHVFNLSNGLPVTDTSCNFHLYDAKTGSHLYTEHDIRQIEHQFDYEVMINASNFTSIGEYRFIMQCNDTAGGLGGFTEVGFEVTANGKNPSDKDSLIPIAIILIGITLILAYAAVNVEQLALKIGLILLTLFMIFTDFFMASRITESTNVNAITIISNLEKLYSNSLTIFNFVFWLVLIFMLYYLYKIMKDWHKSMRADREENYKQ